MIIFSLITTKLLGFNEYLILLEINSINYKEKSETQPIFHWFQLINIL